MSFSLRAEDEREIQELVDEAISFWKGGDAKSFAQLLTKDGRVSFVDGATMGRAQFQTWLGGQLTGPYAGSQLTVRVRGIQFSPDVHVARVDSSFEIVGMREPDSEGLLTREGTFSAIAAKETKRWLLLLASTGAEEGWKWSPPRAVNRVRPKYPGDARRRRIQGLVIVEGILTPEGKMTNLMVLRSIPPLDPAAIEAIRRARWEPARLEGLPVVTRMTLHVTFKGASASMREIVPRLWAHPEK